MPATSARSGARLCPLRRWLASWLSAVGKLAAARRRRSELAAAEGRGGNEEVEGRARGGGVEAAA